MEQNALGAFRDGQIQTLGETAHGLLSQGEGTEEFTIMFKISTGTKRYQARARPCPKHLTYTHSPPLHNTPLLRRETRHRDGRHVAEDNSPQRTCGSKPAELPFPYLMYSNALGTLWWESLKPPTAQPAF